MTLVYDRQVEGGKTHAFVIGCGRFPHYAQGAGDTVATANGARRMVEWLIANADTLIPPLATIEVVLSDPGNAPGEDRLAIGNFEHDPRADDHVDPARFAETDEAGETWTDRCQRGDSMFLYMASHGVVDRDARAMGLLEDVLSQTNRPWKQSVNVAAIAQGLPLLGISAGWVFLDACQHVIQEVLNTDAGVKSLCWKDPDALELAKAPDVRALALAGSRLGGEAYAPTNGDPPFFTQALLEGLRGACVQSFDKIGWAVCSERLMFDLAKVALAALHGVSLVRPQALVAFNDEMPLATIAEPLMPIAVRTSPESEMHGAHAVYAVRERDGHRRDRDDQSMTWRFRVPPDGSRYIVSAEFPPDGPVYASEAFQASPSACNVTLRKPVQTP